MKEDKGRNRHKGPQPPPHVDPLVRKLWDAMPEYVVKTPMVTDRAILRWFRGERDPTTRKLRAALAAVGLRMEAINASGSL